MKKRPQGRPRALTDEQVEWIRKHWKGNRNDGSGLSQKELAFGAEVHPMTIYNVLHERGPYGPKVILVNPLIEALEEE